MVKPFLVVLLLLAQALAPVFATEGNTIAGTWGRWHDADFEHLTVEKGLPHPTTTALAQDRAGLIWIGTIGGLARYDGYRTQIFRQTDESTVSLPDNYVRALAAVDDGSLMVGTNSGGLVRFDPRDNRFIHYDVSTTRGTGSRIFALASDRAGGFWIASQDGLSHLASDLKTLSPPAPALNAQLKADAKTFSVLEDTRGNVWLGTNNGLFLQPAGHDGFERYRPASTDGAATLANDIWAIHEDRQGRVWFGSGSAGVVYIDAKGQLQAPPELTGDSPQIQRRTIRAIEDLPDGHIWMATDGAGIVSYDPSTRMSTLLRHSRSDPASLGGNIVRALLLDRAGGVWAANESSASRHDTRAPSVYTLDGSVLFAGLGTQVDENVRSVYTDAEGIVWLGFNQGRVVAIDPVQGDIRVLVLTGEQAGQDVKAIAALPDGRLIAGARGLVTIDPHTLQTAPYHSAPLDTRPIISLCPCQGALLVGTYDGLYRLRAGSEPELFRHEPGQPRSLTGNQIRNLVPMADGSVWVGTTEGISILRKDGKDFDNLVNDPADNGSLPQDYVGSIVASHGRVWVGTYGGIGSTPIAGLGPHRFQTVSRKEGLGSDNVVSLLADRRGRIWATTANGLTVYDPDTGVAVPLGLRDGYRTRFFNHRTATLGPAGELLFGGIGGLTVVDADADAGKHAKIVDAPLAITSMTINERETPFAALPDKARVLVLDSGTRSLRAGFALLEYAGAADMRYSYRLDGFDDGWIAVEAGAPPTVVYTNLPGGSYTLQLRVALTGLHSQTIETSIPIRVEPRGFERNIFRLGAVLALIALFYLLLRVRTRLLHHRATQLSALVDSRTADLRAANDRLDHLANVDELTGLANRRAIMNLLEKLCARSQTERTPMSLVMLDLDKFKALNDRHGHLAGDIVLKRVADTIAATCRPDDQVGRYGGEELMVLLPDTDANGARDMAERCRSAIERLSIDFGDQQLTLTTSAGVATLRYTEMPASLIARADEALYHAKRAGRNNFQLADA